jgi:protein TonB
MSRKTPRKTPRKTRPTPRFGRRTAAARPSSTDAVLSAFALRDSEQEEDRRRLRTMLLIAAGAHLVLFFIHLPALAPTFEAEAAEPVYVYPVQPLPKFKVEKPPPEHTEPRPELPTIPVPEYLVPEIVREPELPPLDLTDDLPPLNADFEIPNPPPVVAPTVAPAPGPIYVTGEVVPPEALFAPRPQYTEPARRVRLEGTVILEAVIDQQGAVTGLEVLKPMPLGLTEAALAAAKQWRFRPATLRREPVSVYWRLTVTFQLR